MSALPKPEFEYVGIKDCGCCVAVVADIPGYEKHTAETVAEFITDGLKVKRIPRTELDDYLPLGCKHIDRQLAFMEGGIK